MKKRISKLITFCMLLIYSISYAQTSEKGFSFQGFAIDPDGKALSNTNVTVKFKVYPKTGTGETYEEELNTSTDNYGVFSTIIGSDKPADFKKLNFSAKGVNYWLKVEVKKTAGGSYTIINDAEMQAVPYARVADNGVPVGTIVAYAGQKSKVPAGWLICDGTSYDGNDAKYIQLYNVLGTSWGGSGTAFNVPDMRGMFLRGVDENKGIDPNAKDRGELNPGGNTGDNVGSLQQHQIHSHKHTGTTAKDGAHKHTDQETGKADNDDNDGVGYYIGGRGGSYNNNDGGAGFITDDGSDHSHTLKVDNTGGDETRPVNVGVYYIIKQ